MRIDRDLWHRAILLEQEFNKRGERLSRYKLREALRIGDNLAKMLMFGLENRDIIRLEPKRYVVEGEQKVLVLADLHIPYEDRLALEVALDRGERERIDVIVLLGDVLDFYKLSVYNKNPKNPRVIEEIKRGKKFLEELRDRFPEARIIWKEGNHENRLNTYLMKQAKEIYELVEGLLIERLELEKYGVDYVVDPFRLGKLWFLHGHEKQRGAYNVEYITNVIWNYVYDHFIVGHFHREQKKIFKRIDNTFFWGGAVGYLGKILDYAKLNKWTQGFGIIEFDRKGFFNAQLYTIVNGEVY